MQSNMYDIISRYNQVFRVTWADSADSAESAASINANLINTSNRGLPPISGIVRREKKDETSPRAVGLISLLINHVWRPITWLCSGEAHELLSFETITFVTTLSFQKSYLSLPFYLFFLFFSPFLTELPSFEAR